MSELKSTGVINTSLLEEYGLHAIDGWTFSSSGSTITGPSNGQYTIVSGVTSSSWGSQFYITNNGKVRIPWGISYRVSFEAYVPTAHSILIDINNRTETGSNPGGNDNDTGRTSSYFSIPATTWTSVTFGSSNLNSVNTDKEDLLIYDYIGLLTSGDSSSTTWYIRNVKIQVGYIGIDKFAIKTDSIYPNNLIEY